jgi:hypothetical protein
LQKSGRTDPPLLLHTALIDLRDRVNSRTRSTGFSRSQCAEQRVAALSTTSRGAPRAIASTASVSPSAGVLGGNPIFSTATLSAASVGSPRNTNLPSSASQCQTRVLIGARGRRTSRP